MVWRRVGVAWLVLAFGCGSAAEEVSPGGDESSSSGPSGSAGPTTQSTSTEGTTADSASGGSTSSGPTTTTDATSTTDATTTDTTTSDATTTGDPTESGSTGEPAGCNLPVLIHDPFDDGNLATGGPSATNGGVRYDDNGVMDGPFAETGGVARVTTPMVDGGAAPNVGIETLASFDGTTAAGVTAVAVIEAADTPIWQGIVLAIHRDDGFYETAGAPGLELHVFATPATGGASHNDSVVLIAETTSDFDYADLAYDPAALNDGFTLALSANPAGWTLRAEGLTLDDSPLTAEGVWDAGFAYADVLDADSFAAVAIQGTTDQTARTLDVASLTVYAGTCDENVIPNPP